MKPKKVVKAFADLRPNAMIRCMVCNKEAPASESKKFHAHHVCGPCVQKLNEKKEK